MLGFAFILLRGLLLSCSLPGQIWSKDCRLLSHPKQPKFVTHQCGLPPSTPWLSPTPVSLRVNWSSQADVACGGTLQGLNAEICWPELISAEGQACLHELLSLQRCPIFSKCLKACIIPELLEHGNSQAFSSAFAGSCKLQFGFSAKPSERKALHQWLMLVSAADQRVHLQATKAQKAFISYAVYRCHLASQTLTSKCILASVWNLWQKIGFHWSMRCSKHSLLLSHLKNSSLSAPRYISILPLSLPPSSATIGMKFSGRCSTRCALSRDGNKSLWTKLYLISVFQRFTGSGFFGPLLSLKYN